MFSNINFETNRQMGETICNTIYKSLAIFIVYIYGFLQFILGSLYNLLEVVIKSISNIVYKFIETAFLLITYPFRYIYENYYDLIIPIFIYISASTAEVFTLGIAINIVVQWTEQYSELALDTTIKILIYTGIALSSISITKRAYIVFYRMRIEPIYVSLIYRKAICIVSAMPYIIGQLAIIAGYVVLNREKGSTVIPWERTIILLVFSSIGFYSETYILYSSYRIDRPPSINAVVPLVKSEVEELIDKINSYSNSNLEKECSICIDTELSKNSISIDIDIDIKSHIQLECSHIYHKSCIVRWLETGIPTNKINGCPLCRNTISIKETSLV